MSKIILKMTFFSLALVAVSFNAMHAEEASTVKGIQQTIKETQFGVVSGYTKNSSWEEDRHWVEVKAILYKDEQMSQPFDSSDAKKEHFFTIEMEPGELLGFHTDEGLTFEILEELPDSKLFKSHYILQFHKGVGLYEATGDSVSLTRKDFEHQILYTGLSSLDDPSRAYVYLNLYPDNCFLVNLQEQGLSDDYLSKGMSLELVSEEYILDSPGKSNFTLRSVYDGYEFIATGPSLDSHWVPTKKMIENAKEVVDVSKVYISNDLYYVVTLDDGRVYARGEAGYVKPIYYCEVRRGHKLVEISNGVFVNLRTAEFLVTWKNNEEVNCIGTKRYIKRTW